ncbi:MAG TPA: DUF433 domain-containing protein [Solirubrobacteraceae bacterium]|jgi:uncharacterized protein (DUF433 family)/DNA-binding transcriptional MerR regulator
MAFPIPIASVLTGATVPQLAYWRRHTKSAEPLLVPEGRRSGRYLYSWADVVALRSIVYLRQEKSLPRIRRAVDKLRQLEAEEWTHLSAYRLVSTESTIVVQTRAGQLLDLERHPGTVLAEVLMSDVLDPFETSAGRSVPALKHPRPRLAVDPAVLGGYPVIVGTRVPFDVVAQLAQDDLEPDEIIAIYPSVDPGAIDDATGFAEQVAAVG